VNLVKTIARAVTIAAATAGVLALVAGCASRPPADTVVASQPVHRAIDTSDFAQSDDSRELSALWAKRTGTSASADYPVGPGDVLEINAQYVNELKNKTVRVAGDGTIELPLVGVVQAAGLSEDKLADEIARKLSKFMYDPQVQVFVRKFHSHQVAVIGAVTKPGLVTLSDSSETILDMITESGGVTPQAGDEVILFPAGASGDANRATLREASLMDELSNQSSGDRSPDASGGTHGAFESDLNPASLAGRTNIQPIVIPLHSTSLTGAGRFLQLPVRPGDVIVVPGGGEVMVVGWVENPGHFPVGSGLTVLAAIGAAGGPDYAADESDVRLIRGDSSGVKKIIRINLKAIKSGEAPDPPVFANDVIDVPYSEMKIGPYVFYSLFKNVGMGVGFGGAIP
jgi:polysaccharide export outer membrane protein